MQFLHVSTHHHKKPTRMHFNCELVISIAYIAQPIIRKPQISRLKSNKPRNPSRTLQHILKQIDIYNQIGSSYGNLNKRLRLPYTYCIMEAAPFSSTT